MLYGRSYSGSAECRGCGSTAWSSCRNCEYCTRPVCDACDLVICEGIDCDLAVCRECAQNVYHFDPNGFCENCQPEPVEDCYMEIAA